MPSLERDTLLAESKTILKSVTNWKPGKQFKSNVIRKQSPHQHIPPQISEIINFGVLENH